jgi:tetratricopeptide (TPR) repeat protein
MDCELAIKARLKLLLNPAKKFSSRGAVRAVAATFFAMLFGGCAQAWQSAPAKEIGVSIVVVDSESAAQQVVAQLKRGADFATVAKENSTDPTAGDGGYMGPLDPSTLRTELREALAGLKPGQIAGPVKMGESFAILKVLTDVEMGHLENPSAARSFAMQASGNIRLPPEVSGMVDADAALNSFFKPRDWNRDLQKICQSRTQSLALAISRLEKLLSPVDLDDLDITQGPDQMQAFNALGNLYAYKGEMDKALTYFEHGFRVAQSQVPQAIPMEEEILGIAYLHAGELANDTYRSPGDRCILPLPPGVSYKNTGNLEKAVEAFSKYLEHDPKQLDVRYLLNLAFMMLGKYPDGVPPQYLIPPSTFQSQENVVHFTDIAPKVGLSLFSMSGGIIVDDFENNGLLDIVTSTSNFCGSMHYFRNNGDGTFSDHTQQAGLSGQLGGLNMIQADYNNDGCMDILVMRGGWEMPMRPSLLRNNCNGTFTDVTREAGLLEPVATQTGVWADIDNDGYVDLFLGSENGSPHLYHNRRNGTFEDITRSAGVDRVAFNKGIATGDYDNDGYMDFYVSNFVGDHLLYHNNHNLTFTEVGEKAGVTAPRRSFGAAFMDYDNDGWPDLFVTSYYVSVDETVRSMVGAPNNAETAKMYRNMHDGTFKDVSVELGLDKVYMPMGMNFGDVDNDGYLDLYLGVGAPSYASILPKVLLHNDEGKKFVDITYSSGTADLHKGHGVAFADLDNRGEEDIVTIIGGATPGDSHAMRLFENPGNGNDWITLKLVGVKSNRAALGARIKVTVENEGHAPRSIYRTVGSGGTFGASPLQQHIGLGKSAKIDDIEIWWPASGTRQVFTKVEKNQFLAIKEFAKDYTKLERKPFRLGVVRPEAVPDAIPPALHAGESR